MGQKLGGVCYNRKNILSSGCNDEKKTIHHAQSGKIKMERER